MAVIFSGHVVLKKMEGSSAHFRTFVGRHVRFPRCYILIYNNNNNNMSEKQSRKKFKSSKENINVNPVYNEESIKVAFKNHFSDSSDSVKLECGAEIIKNPFTCYVLPNFITDLDFLENLKESLCCLDFKEKNNDLYKFHQSDDLKASKDPYISSIRELLYGNFLQYLNGITGLELNNTIDMSCARYESTDVLLCHDDQLDCRKIAYIYYLVPKNWRKEDGGILDLFNSENRQPKEVVRSLVPSWNNFVFFEVTSKSFHQVSEILTDEKCRLSISGWFHSNSRNVENSNNNINIPIELREPCFVEEEVIYSWINPTYLKEEIQMEIQEKFEEESEIQLVDFFMEDKFMELQECLKSPDLSWNKRGPVNQRNISELDLKDLAIPRIVRECLELLKSEAIFLILSNLTGLSLHPLMASQKQNSEELEDTCEAKCRMTVQAWKHGSYTLLSDAQADREKAGLDAKIFFNAGDWKIEYGGFTSYVAKGEDEELLTVTPADNTLALVYRDESTMSFVKHINYLSEERGLQPFHDIHFIYYE